MAESGASRKNRAAWLPGKFQRLKVSEAPYTPPREHEVVVRNHAVAINPVDWFKQAFGDFMFQWLKYPCVLGSDLAGVVVEIGAGHAFPEAEPAQRRANTCRVIDDLQIAFGIARRNRARRERNVRQRDGAGGVSDIEHVSRLGNDAAARSG